MKAIVAVLSLILVCGHAIQGLAEDGPENSITSLLKPGQTVRVRFPGDGRSFYAIAVLNTDAAIAKAKSEGGQIQTVVASFPNYIIVKLSTGANLAIASHAISEIHMPPEEEADDAK